MQENIFTRQKNTKNTQYTNISIYRINTKLRNNPEILNILVSVHISRDARKYLYKMEKFQKYSIYLHRINI